MRVHLLDGSPRLYASGSSFSSAWAASSFAPLPRFGPALRLVVAFLVAIEALACLCAFRSSYSNQYSMPHPWICLHLFLTSMMRRLLRLSPHCLLCVRRRLGDSNYCSTSTYVHNLYFPPIFLNMLYICKNKDAMLAEPR